MVSSTFLTQKTYSTTHLLLPLNRSSKHMRHHKYCENEGEYPYNDPHSHFRYGWFYGYIVSRGGGGGVGG